MTMRAHDGRVSSLLSTQLLRRGFLIEVVGQDIYLTDKVFLAREHWKKPETNFFNVSNVTFDYISTGANQPFDRLRVHDERPLTDVEMLEALLARIDRGILIRTGKPGFPFRLSSPDTPLDLSEIEQLFRWPVIRSEAFHHETEANPAWFADHPLTPKIPLSILEPRVAMLVKAFSAVGCGVWCSCEGHAGRSDLRLEFMGPLHALWAKYLIEKVEIDGIVGFRVIRERDCFSLVIRGLGDPRRAEVITISQEMGMRVGNFLYQNRLQFRVERKRWMTRFRCFSQLPGFEPYEPLQDGPNGVIVC